MKEKINICRYGLSIVIMICVIGSAIVHAAETRLKVGIYHNPPIVFVDEKGTPQGVYVDTLNSIAKHENWTLDYVFAQWTELLKKVKSGDIDLVTAIAYSPERDTWLDFSREAFAERWGVVYAPAGTSIHAMADLAEKRVALLRQDIHASFFKQAAEAMGLEFTPVEMMGYESVFHAIKNNKVNAGVVNNGYGESNAGSYGLEATPLTFKPTDLVIAFPQGKYRDIADTIDDYLKRWKNDPDSPYLTSYQRWLETHKGQGERLSLTPEQRTWLTAHPTIRVAFDGYFPPYSYLTDDGRVEGLSVDVLRLLADRLGIRLDIHPTFVWEDLFEAAKRQDVEIVATMVQRPERKQWFAFTRPYIYKSLAIITRDDDKSIKKREDIAGKRVTLVRDYNYVHTIIRDFPSLKPYYVDTILDGLNAVATGNADAAITFFGAGSHLKTKYGITNLKFAAVYDRSSALESIGVRKDWPEMVAILDKALSVIEQTELQALQRKWNADETLVTSFQESRLSRQWVTWLIILSVVSGLALFAFAFVSAWNWNLRRQVTAKTRALEEDLIERTKMASALQKSEEHLQGVFRAAPTGIGVVIDRLLKQVNERMCEMTGYSEEELTGQNARILYPSDEDYEYVGREKYEQIRNHGTGTVETRWKHKDGHIIDVLLSSTPMDLGDLSKGVTFTALDITERKRTEEALQASHERFLTVLDSIDATIYVADMETHEILFMNKNMIESFGGDMTGEICFEVFRGESGPCSRCTNDQLIDENGKPTGVCVWQDKNPITEKWYINYDRAIEWTDGRLVRLQIATDITNFKRMEQQLKQTEKFESIGTLAGGIAHDFNNLLMGIQGRASLMSADIKPSHSHSEHLNAIEDYIRSATDLTRQLLGFARGGKYEVKPTDINELVSNSANMFGRTKKEIRIHTKLQTPPPVVAVDRGQIEQVMLNLYVNAWQAMPDAGDLYLETKIVTLDQAYCKPYQAKPGRHAKVSVTDTGIGMDELTSQRIFDPFFTTKEKGRGTGLGLASAYGIIKNHDGIITVYSEVGHGTTFNIYLPLTEKKAHQEIAVEDKIIHGSETILLVDDEKMILDVGQAMLGRLGYKVVIATGGKQAVDAIQRKGDEIKLVILDLIMPEMDGGKVFDRIKKIQPQMPVMLSSGYAINGQADEIMKRGCNGFIQKPFNISELSQKVRNTLDQAKRSTQE